MCAPSTPTKPIVASLSSVYSTRETWHLWLALRQHPTLSLKNCFNLLNHTGTIEALFKTTPHTLTQLGLSAEQIESLLNPNWKSISVQLDQLYHQHIQILPYTVAEYPAQLREISQPPLVLFVQGEVALLQQAQLAIVGARNPSPTGCDIAYQFARALGQAGFVMTSGLALGIDGASHQGALSTPAKTIAVLGCGLDQIYPRAHTNLAQAILTQGGAIISEFPPNTPPKAQHFPQRNRIISGLSLGVLVIEAAQKSGSLITARYALEQNREVFAIPGSIYNPLSKGCHQLIKQGAKLVETIADILEELPPLISSQNMDPKTETILETIPASQKPLAPLDQNLLDQVGFEVTTVDQLIQRTQLNAETISSRLLILELQGKISAIPGGYIKRKNA
jgi:DNA processing protein